MERTRLLGLVVATGLAAALTVAGCAPAEQDPVDESDRVEVETEQETTPTVEATETPQGTVLDIVVDEQDLQTFDQAAREAGLYQALQGLGPYTILAPSDQAFDELGADEVNRLLEPENRDELARLLTFHVIPGRWTPEDLRAARSIPTVSGRYIQASPTTDGEGVRLGGVEIGEPTEQAEVGIVYVIDEVLDPFAGSVTPNVQQLPGNGGQQSEETTP